ncbi:MAG TPA: hypothetical protein VM265_03995 [Sphingomicrobium sp.]|nr:hypothetical protein [Sphingomicrobium sp.]
MAISEGDGREQADPSTRSDAGAADPERGGCMRLGWGCLPVMAVIALLPAGLLF